MLCSQRVVWKERVIKDNRQLYIEEESTLDLYSNQVITPTETIAMKDIHDVSYKRLSGDYGFLYLHTINGVRTYMVKESPEAWMDVYHEHK